MSLCTSISSKLVAFGVYLETTAERLQNRDIFDNDEAGRKATEEAAIPAVHNCRRYKQYALTAAHKTLGHSGVVSYLSR
jgi:hypothetical protein